MVMEKLTLDLPSSYEINKEYLNSNASQIETLVLGSSQLKYAINPEWLESSTINIASGNQHHDSDFKILQALKSRLPNLKTVILEVSYSHFELPHNGKDFWKNSLFLKYYDINCFERPTYFKDRLIYLSRAPFFSNKIYDHFIRKDNKIGYNSFGFDTLSYHGRFKNWDYNEDRIARAERFKINQTPNEFIFQKNTALFYEMLDYSEENNLTIVICTAPMYKTYHNRKNPEILSRRDSILVDVSNRYANVLFLNLETDTLRFKVKDFWNESHLNPDGARKFTRQLDALLNSLR